MWRTSTCLVISWRTLRLKTAVKLTVLVRGNGCFYKFYNANLQNEKYMRHCLDSVPQRMRVLLAKLSFFFWRNIPLSECWGPFEWRSSLRKVKKRLPIPHLRNIRGRASCSVPINKPNLHQLLVNDDLLFQMGNNTTTKCDYKNNYFGSQFAVDVIRDTAKTTHHRYFFSEEKQTDPTQTNLTPQTHTHTKQQQTIVWRRMPKKAWIQLHFVRLCTAQVEELFLSPESFKGSDHVRQVLSDRN